MKQRAGKKGNWNARLILTFLLCTALIAGAIVIRSNGITGMAAKGTANLPPDWTAQSTKFVTKQNVPVLLNLDELFRDPEGQPLTFVATNTENLDVVLEGSQLSITPEPGFVGERIVTVFASDGEQVSRKRLKIEVTGREPKKEEPVLPAPEPAENTTITGNTTAITENITVLENITTENATIAQENTTAIPENTTIENITAAPENITISQQPLPVGDELSAQGIPELPPVRKKIDPALEKALEANESATAIVILNEPAGIQATGRTTRNAALDERKARVKNLREGLVERIRMGNITGFVSTEKMPRPGIRITRTYDTVNVITVNITKEGLESLRNDSSVREVVINKVLNVMLPQSVPLIHGNSTWNLVVSNSNLTGNNETVCITDTGIDYGNFAFNNWGAKVVGGYDFVNEDDHPQDDATNSHGTHCSGIVGANASSLKGVAPDAKIVPVKICNSAGSCALDDMIAGVDYCNNNSAAFNITAISMSIGEQAHRYNSTTCPTWLDSVLSTSVSLGIIPVIAAGNDLFTDGVSYPACSPYAISVGSTTKANAISSFSNYGGDRFDVFAPGSSILSSIRGNTTGPLSGTSMATPHVAGMVAIVQQNQHIQGLPSLTLTQMHALLNSTGLVISSWRRIDVYEAIVKQNMNLTINQSDNSIKNVSANTTLKFSNTTDLGQIASCGKIRHNYVEIDSVNCSLYNQSAHISLGGLSGVAATPLMNNGPCPEAICQNRTFAGGVLEFDVTEFTSYSSTEGNVKLTKNDTDPANASQQLDYKIIMEVLLGNASNISLSDTYPSEVIYLSSQPSPEPGTNNTWIIGNLTENGTFIVNISTFVYNVSNGTQVNNIANITFSNGTDALNNSVSITTLILNPPVFNFTNASVNKSGNVDPANASDYLNYTINVTITGNGTAYNATLNDTYPESVIYIAADPAPVAGTNNTWVLGNLSSGTSILVNVTVLVLNVSNGSLLTNTVYVSLINETGQESLFVETETTNVSSGLLSDSNVSVTKTDGPDPVYTSNNLTYQITVTSTKNETAYNVTVNDTYPNEVIYLTSQPSPLSGTNNTWILGNMTPGSAVSVNVTVLVLNFTNTILINNTVNVTFQNVTGGNLSRIATQNTTVKNLTEFYNCSSCANCTACLAGYGNTCKLTSNISSTGTCIVIGADQAVLDCDGYNIDFDTNHTTPTPEQGVIAEQRTGVTIQNCSITHINTDGNATGILLNGTTDSRILYNNISTNLSVTAMYIEQATGIIIENNTIGGAVAGPSLRGHTISYMNFTNNNVTSPVTAVYVQGNILNSLFSFNTVSSSGLVAGQAEYTGIWLSAPTNDGLGTISNVAVYENNITHSGGNGCTGIYLLGKAANNVIDNNTISITEVSEGNIGIQLYSLVNYTTISGNTILVNGTSGNRGINILNPAERNTVQNNNIVVKGTSNTNWGIAMTTAQTLKVSENNISNNSISVEGTTNNAGIYAAYADNNNYRFNSIKASGTASYGIYLNGTDSTFTSNTLNDTPIWIYSTADATNNNFVNTTFTTPNGSIWLPGNFALPASANITKGKLNITHNRAFLKSTNLAYLNISAQITFNDINFISPSPIADFADTGTFIDCPEVICVKKNYANSVYVLNVTGFTTYSVGGVSLTKLDSKDPINISSYLNYTVIVNVTAGNASNISLTDTYPNETVYISAQPSPEAGTNHTFIIGNLTIGQAFIVNITTIVLNISNGTVINNTANISFQNDTGDWLTINVTENTTILVPPINITFTKTDNPDPVQVNTYLNYTITISIASDDPKNITLTDIYPAEVVYGSAQPTPLAGTNDTWIIGNLSAGQAITINISVLVNIINNGTTINNTANITYQNSTSGTLTQNVTESTVVFDPGPPYINLTGCAIINKSATLLNSIQSTGTCILINASNVFLDCTGYNINYSTSGVNYANSISVGDWSNITIKGCTIWDKSATGTNEYAINFSNTINGLIINNTIKTNGSQGADAIALTSGSKNITITNNTITAQTAGSNTYTIYCTNTITGTLIANNTIVNNATGSTIYGIYTNTFAENTTITNNTIYARSSSGSNIGIFIQSNSNYNNITNNSIYVDGGSVNYAVYLQASDSSQILNNTIRALSSSDSRGILSTSADDIIISGNTIISTSTGSSLGTYALNSNNNIIENNTVSVNGTSTVLGIDSSGASYLVINNNTINVNCTSTGCYGIALRGGTYNSTITLNNVLVNSSTTSSASSEGIYLFSTVSICNVSNNTITTDTRGNTNPGIHLATNVYDNRIENNTILTLGDTSPGILLATAADNNTIYNNNINTSKMESFGIRLSSVTGNNITNNTIRSITDGLFVEGSLIEHFSTHRIVNNTINNSNITYFGGAYDSPSCPNNRVLNGEATAHVDFISCQNITLTNYQAYETIALVNATNITVQGIRSVNNFVGIRMVNTSNSIVTNVNITTNATVSPETYGILMGYDSHNNSINDSNITVKGITFAEGIRIQNSSNITITEMLVLATGATNNIGISAFGSANITINSTDSRAQGTSNDNYGAYLYASSDNTIKDNILVGNGTSSNGMGLVITTGTNNTRAINNTIYGVTSSASAIVGVKVATRSINNVIENNTINTTGSTITTSHGVQLSSTAFTNVTNNRVFASYAGNGIYMDGSNTDNSSIRSNKIIFGGGNQGYGIYLGANPNKNIIIASNEINSSASGDMIYLNIPANTIIENNTITAVSCTTPNGIHMSGSSQNTSISNNILNLQGNSITGIRILVSDNRLNNNTINITGASSSNIGLSLSSASYNTITGTTVITNGTTSNEGIRLLSSSIRNNITNTTIITRGTSTSNIGIELGDGCNNNTFTSTTIITNSTTSQGIYSTGKLWDTKFNYTNITTYGANSPGIYLTSVNNSRFSFTNITTSVNNSPAIYLGTGSSNNLFNNTLLNNTGDWIKHEQGINNKFTNTTFAMPNGSINIPFNFTCQNISKKYINITYNKAYLNSTNLSFMNTTGIITLYGLSLVNPDPWVDWNDDGTYESCPIDVCTKLDYAGGALVYNVSHFTGYSSNESVMSNFSNISVTKTDNPDPVNVSSNLTYQINVSVTGNGTAYNVTVNDTYPADVLYLTSQPTPLAGTNNTWILGNLSQGTNISINITVLVQNISNGTIITNDVNATFQNETTALLSAVDTITTTVNNPIVLNMSNISVAKSDTPDPVSISSQLNYTITVTSNGDAPAYNVTANDTYPNETIYLTSQPAPLAGTNNTWILGNLSTSTIRQINISVWVRNITNGTVINNTVNVTFHNETSALHSRIDRENTTVENITVRAFNLSNLTISKTDYPDPVNASSNLTYQINVTSSGNGTAFNATVNDTYPNETIYLTSQPDPLAGTNNTWILGNLSQGTNVSINITVLVMNISNGSVINNTVNVTFQNETSYILSRNTSESTTVLNPPLFNFSNISISKTDDPDPVNVSSNLTYQINVSSTGNSTAHNVTVNDTYPNEVIYLTSQPDPVAGTNNTWLLGDLAPGTNFSVNITVLVLNISNGTTITNNVNVTFQNDTSDLLSAVDTITTLVTNPIVLNMSNISLTKTDTPDPVETNNVLNYTITVTSNGDTTAYNVTVNDTYPDEVIYQSSEPAPLAGTNNTWILGNLTVDTTIRINISLLVTNPPNGTVINNTVNVTFQNDTSDILSKNASASTTVLNPAFFNFSNASVTKTDDLDPVNASSNLTYQINVSINGNETTYNVTVNDTYPAEVIYLTSQPDPVPDTNNTWVLGNLTVGTNISINITVLVLNITNGTLINNTANVTFQNTTSSTFNTADTENTTVLNPPLFNLSNISVTKTDDPDPVSISTNLAYQINVTSNGNGTAFNVTANDTYPNEVIYLTSQPAPVAGTNNTWILGNLTPGTSFSINITVLATNQPNGTVINNTVNVTFQNETSDNVSVNTSTSTTILNPPLFNFSNASVTKTDYPDPVNASTNLTYQINVSINGNETTYNVTVNDTYPAEVIYLTSQPDPVPGTNNTWILGNLSVGTNISINITVLVLNITNGTLINNTANVTFQNTTGTAFNTADTENTTILNPPLLNSSNISVTKTDYPDPVNASTNLTYQINVTSSGNGTAFNVTVNDTYPNEVIYLTSQPDPVPGTNNTWILGNLAQGTNISINITVLVLNITDGSIINNTVNVTFQNETSGNLSVNTSASTTVLNPPVLNFSNISVTKTDNPDPVNASTNLTYQINVTSNGNNATAWNITVNDTYPNETIYLSSQPDPLAGTNNTWIIGNLTSGTNVSVNITLLVLNISNGAVINNTVNVTFQNETSTLLSANASASTTVLNPPFFNFSNASVAKTDYPDPVNASSNLTYQINVSINGNETTYNVTVNDTYPAEVIYLTSQPDPVPGTNNTWVLGNLTVGTNISINITVLVLNITNGTVINNTANVTFQNTTSSTFNTADTENTTILNPPLFNLSNISVTKTDSPDPVSTSTNLAYQINVSVTGNGTAYNVTVNDTYPNEVIYLTSQPTPLAGTNNTWILGNLSRWTNVSINITVLVRNITNGSLINNTVNVTFQNETSASLSANASASTTVEVPAAAVFNFSNISVAKTDSPDPVNASTNLTYQINVSVTGNGTAYNVTVNDTYPNQSIYLTSQPSPLSGTNNTWTLGNLTQGTNISINITLLVLNITNGTVINNTANATFQNETSALLSANASASTTVLNPPLFNFSNISITKTNSPDPVAPGATLSYTIRVSSTGNGTAYNVTVNDTYPGLVVYSTSQPTPLAGTNNTWILGNLTSGTVIVINITVTVPASVPNSVALNNTVNATFNNETSALLSANASSTATVTAAVPPSGGGSGASTGFARSTQNITGVAGAAEKPVMRCVESWQCNAWGLCADNRQVRTCTDLNGCNTRRFIPPTERECEQVIVPAEEIAVQPEQPALPAIGQPAAAKPIIGLFRPYILPAILALIVIALFVIILVDVGRRKKKPEEMPGEMPEAPLPEEEPVPEPEAVPEPEETVEEVPEQAEVPVVPPKPAEPKKEEQVMPRHTAPAIDKRALMRIDSRLAEIDKSLGRLRKTHRRLQGKVRK